MFGADHYVPILKGKKGDMWALRHTSKEHGARVTPMIEVVPPTSKQTESSSLELLARLLAGSWAARRSFVDLLWRDGGPPFPNGMHVVDAFFEHARRRGLPVVPVTALSRTPAYQQAVGRVHRADGSGIALRLAQADFDEPGLDSLLDGLFAVVGVTPAQVDLVIDFGSVREVAVNLLAQNIRSAVEIVPDPRAWRTLTVAAGSFVTSLTTFPQAEWTLSPRREWRAYKVASAKSPPMARMPAYGDYAVGDPGLPFSGRANIAANLRYSCGDDFLIWRGYDIKTHPEGCGQMHKICADLVDRPEFVDADFSQGDREIYKRATTEDSPGGAADWRQWATNHYIALVASQLSSPPAWP